MKNHFEQNKNPERRNEMPEQKRTQEEYAVYLNSNDNYPTTYTFALSLKEAKSHMLSPDKRKIFANAGRTIIDLSGVEKLTFKKTGKTLPVTTKKIDKEKIAGRKFWWDEGNDFTEADRIALLKH